MISARFKRVYRILIFVTIKYVSSKFVSIESLILNSGSIQINFVFIIIYSNKRIFTICNINITINKFGRII